MCVCVCERERERETSHLDEDIFPTKLGRKEVKLQASLSLIMKLFQDVAEIRLDKKRSTCLVKVRIQNNTTSVAIRISLTCSVTSY